MEVEHRAETLCLEWRTGLEIRATGASIYTTLFYSNSLCKVNPQLLMDALARLIFDF